MYRFMRMSGVIWGPFYSSQPTFQGKKEEDPFLNFQTKCISVVPKTSLVKNEFWSN